MKWLKKKSKELIDKQELIDRLWELREYWDDYWKIEDVIRVINKPKGKKGQICHK